MSTSIYDGLLLFSMTEGLSLIISQMMLRNTVRINYKNEEGATVSKVFLFEKKIPYEGLLVYYLEKCRKILQDKTDKTSRVIISFNQTGKHGTAQCVHVRYTDFESQVGESLEFLRALPFELDTSSAEYALQSCIRS